MYHLPWGNNLAAEANPTPLENPKTHWEVPCNRGNGKKTCGPAHAMAAQRVRSAPSPSPGAASCPHVSTASHNCLWQCPAELQGALQHHPELLPAPGRVIQVLGNSVSPVGWRWEDGDQPLPPHDRSRSFSCHINFEAK